MAKRKKQYPFDVKDVRENLSLSGNAEILGSFSIKGQEKYGDIDLYENVKTNSLRQTVKKFRSLIKNYVLKNKDVYFMELKVGLDINLRIIDETSYHDGDTKKVYGYDFKHSLARLEEIKHLLPKEEYTEAKNLLVPKPTEKQLVLINKNLRFHIVRWRVKDILRGYVNISTGKLQLVDAIKQSLFKLDVIVFLRDRYIETSIIYNVILKGKRVSPRVQFNYKKEMLFEIRSALITKRYFKALKRLFSYSYVAGKRNEDLEAVLNGELGSLYQVKNILECLDFLIREKESIPEDRMALSINTMISLLNTITDSSVEKYIKHLKDIFMRKSKQSLGKLYDSISALLDKKARKHVLKFNRVFDIAL